MNRSNNSVFPKKVILIGDHRRSGIKAIVADLSQWLKENRHHVTIDLANRLDISRTKADLIIVFGGDGAILATARRLRNNRISVVGVNVGKFGFLATYSPEELKEFLGPILKHRDHTTPRMMLHCAVIREGKTIAEFIALNDVVITRGTISRMIYLKLSINGQELTTFGADGLIVSTPVGSTAHSLSAGGPLVHHSLKSLIITPICAHTLSMRPVVISPDQTVTVEVVDEGKEVVLTIDGQLFKHLRPWDKINISAARQAFYLVDHPRHNFYDTLQEKLNWGRREP